MPRMSLVSRVSAFFLVALAIALVGYSAVLYAMLRHHLYGQFDDGLHNALRILSAAVEVENDDAKWQPGEFAIDLAAVSDVVWVVTNDQGQMIDHSPLFTRGDVDDAQVLRYAAEDHGRAAAPVSVGPWRVLQTQLDAPTPKEISLREPHEYAGVRITVARSPVVVQTQLRQLGLLLCLLPIAVWLVAAVAGRWYSRQALRPVEAMASQARSTQQADFALRLPVSEAGDELSELGEAFNLLLDRLQVAYDREHRFTGNAAHQLRTPLTVLMGQIDVALRKPRTTDEYRHTMELLAGQVREFQQIVESLLFLARSDGNALASEFTEINLREWLTRYWNRWHDHSRHGDLELVIAGDATVRGSNPLLDQVLDNLVTNALKYSTPGTPVVVRATVDGSDVMISVADRGMGLDAEDAANVFEPFFRSHSAREAGVGGTGLGLAVARQIAHAMRGELTVESRVGEGSTFALRLPVER
ncbi:ATP-binding protein [Aeoliella sp. SH292]|uniref:sensor histidine kinase n=1 Tax=Aeoliella sp. SH292 TaxID=3454464 RepID=UPI003F95E6C1